MLLFDALQFCWNSSIETGASGLNDVDSTQFAGSTVARKQFFRRTKSMMYKRDFRSIAFLLNLYARVLFELSLRREAQRRSSI